MEKGPLGNSLLANRRRKNSNLGNIKEGTPYKPSQRLNSQKSQLPMVQRSSSSSKNFRKPLKLSQKPRNISRTAIKTRPRKNSKRLSLASSHRIRKNISRPRLNPTGNSSATSKKSSFCEMDNSATNLTFLKKTSTFSPEKHRRHGSNVFVNKYALNKTKESYGKQNLKKVEISQKAEQELQRKVDLVNKLNIYVIDEKYDRSSINFLIDHLSITEI